MRPSFALLLAAVLGGALLPAAAAAAAAARQHDHAAAPAPPAEAASKPATAKRFATDATLRKEMQGIRAAVEALAHHEMGHMGEAQAVELAAGIEGHVRTIIANCRLPPDADAALHAIIVPLMQNAGALRKNPKDLSAIPPMREALARHDSQFQDPQA